MKAYNQLTKDDLYREYVKMKRLVQSLSDRLNQHHEEFMPPEIRDEMQSLYGHKHDLTLENRMLKARVNDLRTELLAAQEELKAAEWWVK